MQQRGRLPRGLEFAGASGWIKVIEIQNNLLPNFSAPPRKPLLDALQLLLTVRRFEVRASLQHVGQEWHVDAIQVSQGDGVTANGNPQAVAERYPGVCFLLAESQEVAFLKQLIGQNRPT